MRKDSLKEKLRNYIRGYAAPVPHWQLMNCVKAWGYRESNAERRLREMVEIEKIYEHNTIKYYQWRKTASQNDITAPQIRQEVSAIIKTPEARAFLKEWLRPKPNPQKELSF